MKPSLLSHDVLSGLHVIAVDFRVAASCAGFASVASDLRNLSCNLTDTEELTKFNQCTYLRSPTSSTRFLLPFVSNSHPHNRPLLSQPCKLTGILPFFGDGKLSISDFGSF